MKSSSTLVSTYNDLFADKGDRYETAGANILTTQFNSNSSIQTGISLRLLTDAPLTNSEGYRLVDFSSGPNGMYETFGPKINSGSSLTFVGNYQTSNLLIGGEVGSFGGRVGDAFQNRIIHAILGYPYFDNGADAKLGGSLNVSGAAPVRETNLTEQ